MCFGFRILGLRFRVLGLGYWVYGALWLMADLALN